MKVKIKYDKIKETEIETDVLKIVAEVKEVYFYLNNGEVKKAVNAEKLALALTFENSEVRFNRKIKFIE
jgi:hypothetical protein